MKKIRRKNKGPKAPNKIIQILHDISYPDLYNDSSVSVADFKKWLDETVPSSAIDPQIVLCMDTDYGCACSGYSSASISITYAEEINNPDYDEEYKKYQKKIAKLNKENK